MRIFKSQVHPLLDVRASLERDDDMSFISLMEKHHDFMKESIRVLLDKECLPNEKQAQLGRFLHLLAMHSKAEEETLYLALKTAGLKLARVEGARAQDEHDIAAQLSDELKDTEFESIWTEEIEAKAQVLANLVFNHMEEEETETFGTAKKDLSREELKVLRDEYVDRCRFHLDEELSVSPTVMNENRPNRAF